MSEKSSLQEMLNEGISVVLGDGNAHKLKQLGIIDAKNIEKETGQSFVNIKLDSFEVMSAILFAMLRKSEKDLNEDKMNRYFTLSFMSSPAYQKVLEAVTLLVTGKESEQVSPNSPGPGE